MNSKLFYSIYQSPYGDIFICERSNALTHLVFSGSKLPKDALQQSTTFLQSVASQLDEYFLGQRKVFDIKLNAEGTEFQKRVWQALLTIPYGETASYAQIAQLAGSPKAYRAVGGANNKNPISIIVPCHRIIGTNGKLTGYGGGLPMKEALLDLEQKYK